MGILLPLAEILHQRGQHVFLVHRPAAMLHLRSKREFV
jgi:hypothetical protein